MGHKCRTTGKLMFGKSGAEKVAQDMFETGKSPEPLRVYKCEYCHKWHMSSMPKTKRNQVRNEIVQESAAEKLAKLRKRNPGT